MERQGATIYSRVASGWETARATEFISKGSRQVTLLVTKMTRYMMAGCYRKEYMLYEQHPHSSTQGDIYPEGWVWYSANGGFSNYAPYGGTFKRVSTKTNRWVTNNFLQVVADASGRACYTSWRAGESGDFTLIAQWTNLNIGRGMCVGFPTHDNGDGLTIVE